MHQHTRSHANRTHTDRHVEDLIEVLEELLAVPELRGCEPDEIFKSTLEVMARARVVRSAVLDELTWAEGGAP